ncbi:TetR/AcrR family transcriptional regulator [Mycobacterium sp. TY814]|uniref:TetR/AcrR family transcriptional regulator n=1 Tax=unclassified Mycobacterium TaxID=2642494 RepID=UPI0027410952|nr:TetR/AcrR family transcriptional regulator [Mycobacterium sp. TY814]MDP7724073.1 TetR/AcrR family transcriptional regulator [Mycobacterium sp. TY814]
MRVSTSERESRRTYDNSRRQAEAEARQRRIVTAATALFVEKGFAATSIDQIAQTAGVSPQTVYAAFGSKAGVLSKAIDVAVLGDYGPESLVDRAPLLADMSSEPQRMFFATAAHFVRELHERVAPLIQVMLQAGLDDLRTLVTHKIRADCASWVEQLGPALRPSLTKDDAADILVTIQAPYLFSLFTVDLGRSPDEYEKWLADALARMLLRPELLSE